jgi:hypothetical protein
VPQPFSALTSTEQYLYGALATSSDLLDWVTESAIADASEELGHKNRADLLRKEYRLTLLELLHGQVLTERDCAEILSRPAPAAKWIARILKTSEKLILPDLRTSDGVRVQYEQQRLVLAYYRLLSEQDGAIGIIGVDGRFHPLPSLDMIQSRLKTDDLRRKIEKGFDQLLLVPFALPLDQFIIALRRALIQNESHLNRMEPVSVSPGYQQEQLIYHPRAFSTDHGGRTKTELLAGDAVRRIPPHSGWDALLIERNLWDLPRHGHGAVYGGRRQIECLDTPVQYLGTLPPDEVGWTPETYVHRSLLAAEQGQLLDEITHTYLIGAFLSSSRVVPIADFRQQQVRLNVRETEHSGGFFGARAAVCVL